MPNEVVWLTEERTYAYLINLGAHFSLVRYTRGGIDYEVIVENNEYILGEEYTIDYESE